MNRADLKRWVTKMIAQVKAFIPAMVFLVTEATQKSPRESASKATAIPPVNIQTILFPWRIRNSVIWSKEVGVISCGMPAERVSAIHWMDSSRRGECQLRFCPLRHAFHSTASAKYLAAGIFKRSVQSPLRSMIHTWPIGVLTTKSRPWSLLLVTVGRTVSPLASSCFVNSSNEA